MTVSFETWVHSTQQNVECALAGYLPDIHHNQNALRQLYRAMHYAVLNGGKRIRPLLVHAVGMLFDAQDRILMPTACAIEMIHAYSLVHDDMPCMDNDVLRRGKPTVHIQYGEAMALLVGDALQAQAFAVIAESGGDAALNNARMRVLTKAAGPSGMCGGQAIDLNSIGISLSSDDLKYMDRLKTGAILKASVLLGALSSKMPADEELVALEHYAEAIGLAFQVVDDILDVTSKTEVLGKTAGKDERDAKPTYVSLMGLEKAKILAETLCKQAHDSLALFDKKKHWLHELADLIVYRKK